MARRATRHLERAATLHRLRTWGSSRWAEGHKCRSRNRPPLKLGPHRQPILGIGVPTMTARALPLVLEPARIHAPMLVIRPLAPVEMAETAPVLRAVPAMPAQRHPTVETRNLRPGVVPQPLRGHRRQFRPQSEHIRGETGGGDL